MYTHAHAHTHTHTNTQTHKHTHKHTHLHTHTCTYAHKLAHMHACTHPTAQTPTSTQALVCLHTHMHVLTRAHPFTHAHRISRLARPAGLFKQRTSEWGGKRKVKRMQVYRLQYAKNAHPDSSTREHYAAHLLRSQAGDTLLCSLSRWALSWIYNLDLCALLQPPSRAHLLKHHDHTPQLSRALSLGVCDKVYHMDRGVYGWYQVCCNKPSFGGVCGRLCCLGRGLGQDLSKQGAVSFMQLVCFVATLLLRWEKYVSLAFICKQRWRTCLVKKMHRPCVCFSGVWEATSAPIGLQNPI